MVFVIRNLILTRFKLTSFGLCQMNFYHEHIQTSFTQKLLLAAGSAVASILDPHRHGNHFVLYMVNYLIVFDLDMIAVFGETTGHYALEKIYNKMSNDSEGSEILKEQPRINSSVIDIEKLGKLPSDSFGRKYYDFLNDNVILNYLKNFF